MSTVSKISAAGHAFYQKISPVKMSEKSFNKLFGSEKAIQLVTDEFQMSGERSITSYAIGECITVFVVEKIDGKTDSIMGWHLSLDSTVDDIIGDFNEMAEAKLDHDIYIIGGTEDTVEGEDCLLENIREAISRAFKGKSKIVLELLNLNTDGKFDYISANLQMNGTLSYCHHN
jgi:hypothetical protein